MWHQCLPQGISFNHLVIKQQTILHFCMHSDNYSFHVYWYETIVQNLCWTLVLLIQQKNSCLLIKSKLRFWTKELSSFSFSRIFLMCNIEQKKSISSCDLYLGVQISLVIWTWWSFGMYILVRDIAMICIISTSDGWIPTPSKAFDTSLFLWVKIESVLGASFPSSIPFPKNKKL